MTFSKESAQPEAVSGNSPTMLELIEEAQKTHGWTDKDIEHRLGLPGDTLLPLIRKGVVQLSPRGALDLEPHLNVSALEVLQALIRSNMTEEIGCLPEVIARMTLRRECYEVVVACCAVQAGEKTVVSVKWPQATVLVVPDTVMKPATEADNVG